MMAFRVCYILSTIVYFEIFRNKIFKNNVAGKKKNIYIYSMFFSLKNWIKLYFPCTFLKEVFVKADHLGRFVFEGHM